MTRGRLGLRARVTVGFAAGAALLSGVLAGTTYGFVHHDLLDQQVSDAVHRTYSDARVVNRAESNSGTDLGEVLTSLVSQQGTVALVYRAGEWYSGSLTLGGSAASSRPAELPQALVNLVSKSIPASQLLVYQGQPGVAVGVSLPSAHAEFFEIYPLQELSRTLTVLAWALLACAMATTAAGGLLGRWASGRLLRPLRDIAGVAAAVSGGELDKRLPPTNDPDLRVLSASFNEMVSALQQRIRRDARFAADVSHELRSPLTTVQAAAEFLSSSNTELPADSQAALDMLTSEIDRLSSMVKDLLEISRFDTGPGLADREEALLEELVVNTVEAHSLGTVPVTVEQSAVGAWLSCDPRRLKRVLVNLLDNAKTHGGGAVGVFVSRQGGEALVTVDDAGPGVPEGERGAIFERFYRGGAAGRRATATGTGLGLALVTEHVRAHKGTVEVLDRPGGGARFVVHIPVSEEAEIGQ